jgi:uridine phosphorylase
LFKLFSSAVVILVCIFLLGIKNEGNEPVVTAEKYVNYKKENGWFKDFHSPKIVLITYQKSLFPILRERYALRSVKEFPNLYLIDDGEIGILQGCIGATGIAGQVEQLIALGVKRFIAVGTAGALGSEFKVGDWIISPKALAEDGVSHLYIKEKFAKANPKMIASWKEFTNEPFHSTACWSFSAIFRETLKDVRRVKAMGCGVVEMEAATLYAICQAKGAEVISLFVISDNITEEEWAPKLKDPLVSERLLKLFDLALQFSQQTT